MKKLLSFSLAVLLVASLGITLFPSQSVYAHHIPAKKIIFNITAKGQGEYSYNAYTNQPVWSPGEFSIVLAGELFPTKHSHNSQGGYANPPKVGGGGHISGLFDGHELNINYQVYQVRTNVDWNGIFRLLHIMGSYHGTIDGNVFEKPRGDIAVYDNALGIRTIEINLYIPNPIAKHITIRMYETGNKAADMFKVNIREVGN